MNEAPVLAAARHHAFERDIVELISLQPTAQAAVQHRIRETHLQPRILAFHVLQVGRENPAQPLAGEDRIAKILQQTLDEEGKTDKLLTEIAMELSLEPAMEDDE